MTQKQMSKKCTIIIDPFFESLIQVRDSDKGSLTGVEYFACDIRLISFACLTPPSQKKTACIFFLGGCNCFAFLFAYALHDVKALIADRVGCLKGQTWLLQWSALNTKPCCMREES